MTLSGRNVAHAVFTWPPPENPPRTRRWAPMYCSPLASGIDRLRLWQRSDIDLGIEMTLENVTSSAWARKIDARENGQEIGIEMRIWRSRSRRTGCVSQTSENAGVAGTRGPGFGPGLGGRDSSAFALGASAGSHRVSEPSRRSSPECLRAQADGRDSCRERRAERAGRSLGTGPTSHE